MKKLLALILALVMVFSMTACGDANVTPSEVPSENSAQNSSETPNDVSEEEEPLVIKWVVHNDPNSILSNSDESEIKTLLEEKYNIKIDVQEVDVHNTESLGLYLAGGGDFDVITGTYQVWELWSKLISEGFLRTIPEGWLDQYAPDWMASCLEKATAETLASQTQVDGETYIMPLGTNRNAYLMATRRDWLEAVGMDVPTNLEELTELLIAYHTMDPDGNGQDDTYGTHIQYFDSAYYAPALNANMGYFFDENGKVIDYWDTDASLEYLKTLQYLVAEGGIDPESITDSEDIWKDKFINGKIGVFVHDLAYYSQNWTQSMYYQFGAMNPDTELVIIPPIEDANGVASVMSMDASHIMGGSLAFGVNCSDEVMQKVMEIKNDLCSDHEFYKRVYYGVEGIHYEEDENGVITALEYSDADKDPFMGAMFASIPVPNEWSQMSYSDYDKELYNTYNDHSAYPQWKAERAFFTFETNESYNRYIVDIWTSMQEYKANIYDPDFDFDGTWEAHQQSLDDMGRPAIIDEYNAIFGN